MTTIHNCETAGATSQFLNAFFDDQELNTTISWFGTVSIEGVAAGNEQNPIVTVKEVENHVSNLLKNTLDDTRLNARERINGQALCTTIEAFQAFAKTTTENANFLIRIIAYARSFFQSTFDPTFVNASFGMATEDQIRSFSIHEDNTLTDEMKVRLTRSYPGMTYVNLEQLSNIANGTRERSLI